MNDGWTSDIATRSWARFVWSPSTGVSQASGDCERLLGIEARALVESTDPLRLLPQRLSASLMSGIPETPFLTGSDSLVFTLDPSAGGTVVTVFEFLEAGAGGGSMVEDIGTGVAGIDSAGIVRLWNRRMGEIFPIQPESALGRALESLVPAPLLFGWNGVMSAVADGRSVRAEIRPGPQRRIEAVFSPGGPGMIGVFLDTSDGFEAERRLRSARRMNQTYFQSISTGLVMLGSDLRILVSNRSFGQIFGVREGLPGMPVYEVLPPESFASLDRAFRRFQAGEFEVPSTTVSFSLPGGERRVVAQTFRPVRSDEDDSLHLVGIFEDLTDRFVLSETLEKASLRTGRMAEFIERLDRSDPAAVPDLITLSVNDISGASASALFRLDKLGSSHLAASCGEWPFSLPEDFVELRLQRSSWNESPGLCIRLDELRPGSGTGGFVDVIPVGTGQLNIGCLLLLFEELDDAQSFLRDAPLIVSHIRNSLESATRLSQVDHMVSLYEKEKSFSSDLVSGLGLPVAVFGEDWRVLFWNREMAEITGLDSESARKRSGTVVEMLFGPIGGIAEARKMVGNAYSVPMIWTVKGSDGAETSCSWRLFRSVTTERDTSEAVSILSGVKLGESAGDAAGRRQADPARLYSGALSRLAYAAGPRQFTTALAEFAAAVTGAEGVTALLPMHDGLMEARAGRTRGDRTISLPIPSMDGIPTHPARLEMTADASRDYLDIIGSLASSALAGSLSCSLGRGLIAEGRAAADATAVLTDEDGLLTSPGVMEGMWVESGVHISRFVGSGTTSIREALRTANMLGRASPFVSSTLSGRKLRVFPLMVDGRPRFAWLSGAADSVQGPPPWLRVIRDLSIWLPDRIHSSRGRLAALSRLLRKDDPVRPAIMSVLLDMASFSKISSYTGLMGRALMSRPAGVPSEDVLNLLVQKCISKGRRPPDLDMSSDPPMITADAGLLSDILEACILPAGRGSIPSIRVGRAPFRKENGGGTQAGAGSKAVFEIRWESPLDPRIPAEKALELAAGGSVTPGVELELLAIALDLAGCIFELDGNEIRITVPAEQDHEVWPPEG